MAMADDKPIIPGEESKKDTVRINLPPGITGRSSSVTPPPSAPVQRPPSTPTNPEEEAKKETSVMGRPTEAPKPKKDTSRVQVAAAKPITAETPRPTVKLRREDEAPVPAAPAATAAAPAGKAARPAAAPAAAATPGGLEMGLSLAALVLSIAVAGYLAFVAFG
jgi:outer membrane biosynthesis protein TonB